MWYIIGKVMKNLSKSIDKFAIVVYNIDGCKQTQDNFKLYYINYIVF